MVKRPTKVYKFCAVCIYKTFFNIKLVICAYITIIIFLLIFYFDNTNINSIGCETSLVPKRPTSRTE